MKTLNNILVMGYQKGVEHDDDSQIVCSLKKMSFSI